MDKKILEMLADKLMFTMNESEYETLSQEFEVILKQMDMIGEIPNIENLEPLIHPIEIDVSYRVDEVVDELPLDDILLNSGSNLYNQVKLPKVVE